MDQSTTQTRGPLPWRSLGILLIITLAGALVRFWGIGFGLPVIEARPDEPVVTVFALRFYEGDFNPHFFRWPSLFFYIVHFLYRLILPWVFAPEQIATFPALLETYNHHPAAFFLIPRALSALMGTLTIPLLYWAMRRFKFDDATAQIAALFMALTYLHARDSHFGVTDVAMTALIVAAMIPIAGIMRGRVWGSSIAAGVLWGLASSLKYNALMLGAPVAAAFIIYWLDHRDGGKDGGNATSERENDEENQPARRRPAWLTAAMGFGLCGACFLAGFIGGSPYILLDYPMFLEEFLFQISHVSGGHGMRLGLGWWRHLSFSLPHGAGITMMLAGAAGLAVALRRSWRAAAVLFVFPILYYAAIGKGYTVFARYMIPVLPFLAAAAAIAAVALIRAAERRMPHRAWMLATGAVVIGVVVFPSAYQTLKFNRAISQRDNRLVTAEYLIEHFDRSRSLGLLMTRWAYPNFRAMGEDGRRFAADARLLRFAYDKGAFEWNGEALDEWPDFILLSRIPMPQYNWLPREAIARLDSDYVEQKVFFALPQDEKRNVFDHQDAFFLPFAGFHGVERPGPTFVLLRKRHFQSTSDDR